MKIQEYDSRKTFCNTTLHGHRLKNLTTPVTVTTYRKNQVILNSDFGFLIWGFPLVKVNN